MDSSVQKPSVASGKICYLEIPATNVQQSADFYHHAFGWPLHPYRNGSFGFDDAVGGVSGMWVLDRKPTTEAGLIISIMVANAVAACAAIVAGGGKIVRPIDPDAAEIVAWFTDPAGNLMGIYQDPELARQAKAT